MGAKAGIVIVVFATAVGAALFIQWDEPSLDLQLYKTLAKIGSLSATVLLFWQMLLGFRGVVRWVTPDVIWAVELHKKIGTGVAILILLHPVFITIYYLHRFGRNLWVFPHDAWFDGMVIVGIVSLVVLGAIALTSIFWRHAMDFRVWFYLHLTSYVLLPAVLVHSLAIGMTLRDTPLRFGWIAIAILLALLYVYRALFRAGLWTRQYKVADVIPQGPDTVEIVMEPHQAISKPRIGQFVYVRQGRLKAAKPYTVSDWDEQTGRLSITAKAFGRTSGSLQLIHPGEELALDGPYGVFGQEVMYNSRPVVMAAGGIGITAFRRLIRFLEARKDREAILFYGNNTTDEICYGPELEQLEHVRVVHVIAEQDDYPGEQGYITPELIRKYLRSDLGDCEFLLCGPPVMIRKLEDQLDEEGVASDRIHHELFSE